MNPHDVLIDSLYEVASVLLRAAGEAAASRAPFCRCYSWRTTHVLRAVILAQDSSLRDKRRDYTICQILYVLVGGGQDAGVRRLEVGRIA